MILAGVDASRMTKTCSGLRYLDFVIPLESRTGIVRSEQRTKKIWFDKIEQMLAAGATMQSANDNAIAGVIL